jgi:hypothetical protein
VSAGSTGDDQESLVYNGGIDANVFNPGDFSSEPSGSTPDTVIQDGPNGLQLMFTPDISSDSTVDYTGTAAGILTPDTVAIT